MAHSTTARGKEKFFCVRFLVLILCWERAGKILITWPFDEKETFNVFVNVYFSLSSMSTHNFKIKSYASSSLPNMCQRVAMVS